MGFRIELTMKKRSKFYESEVICSCGNNEWLKWRSESPRLPTETIIWACSKCGRLHKEQVFETMDGSTNVINYEVLDNKLTLSQLKLLDKKRR